MKRRDFLKKVGVCLAGTVVNPLGTLEALASDYDGDCEANDILSKYGISLNDVREDVFYSGLRLEENILGRDLSSEKDFYLSLKDKLKKSCVEMRGIEGLREISKFLIGETSFVSVPEGRGRTFLSQIFCFDDLLGNRISADCDTSSILIQGLYSDESQESKPSLRKAPRHAFLNIDGKNYEALTMESPSDEFYIGRFNIPEESIQRGIYLSNLSTQQNAANLLALCTLGFPLTNYSKIMELGEDVLKLDFNHPFIRVVLGNSCLGSRGSFLSIEERLDSSVEASRWYEQQLEEINSNDLHCSTRVRGLSFNIDFLRRIINGRNY